MSKINKLTFVKVLGLGAVLTTPLIFMTSCSSGEIGTPKTPYTSVNNKNVEDYGDDAASAKAIAGEIAQFFASTIPVNYNHASNETTNLLLAGTPDDTAKAFDFFWTTEFTSGSGPFIDKDKVLGLTLDNVNLVTTQADWDNITKKPSGAGASQALTFTSVEMKFVWWNKYQARTVSGQEVKDNLNYWLSEGTILDTQEHKNFINGVKDSYTITFNFNGVYNLEAKEANSPWSIKDATWTFPGATGSLLNGKSFERKPDVHQIADLISQFRTYNEKSQKPKDNVNVDFYKEIKTNYGGMIKSVS